jgi:hypothetical protein
MRTFKLIVYVGLIISLYACNDNTTNQPSEDLVLNLDNLKKSLPQSLLNSNKLIYLGKEGKEIEVQVEYLERNFEDKHPSGLSYKREEFLIKLTNNLLRINTTLSASSQLAYGDENQKIYSIIISDNNPYKEALKNTIILGFLDDTKAFIPENFTTMLVNKEILLGSEFDSLMKSNKLSIGEAGTRFNKELGVVSIVDYDNNMYIIKKK